MDPTLEDVCRQHRGRLVRLLVQRTGDADAAEDIAQETFVRALRHLDGFDRSRPMWPWLRAIALNRAATWAARRPEVACLEGVDPASDARDLTEVESRETLRAVMVGLTETQRRALWLRYVEDQDSRKAAAALGLSVAAFKQLLHRARNRLRVRFEDLGESVLTPVLLSMRSLRRVLTGSGRSDATSVHRAAEALVPIGTAVVALLFVIGGSSVPPAGAGERDATSAPPRVPAITQASTDRPPPKIGRADARSELRVSRRPGPDPQDVPPPKEPRHPRQCAAGSACVRQSGLPDAPSAPRRVENASHVSPIILADSPAGDVCTPIGCVVEDPNSGPGPKPALPKAVEIR